MERVGDSSAGVARLALELLRKEIRESTSSMTAVPKPLKFLSPHWNTLTSLYKTSPNFSNKISSSSMQIDEGANNDQQRLADKRLFSDILSVLAMTMGAEGKRESLYYKLQGNSTDIGDWGHEYVRALAGEVGTEYSVLIDGGATPNSPSLVPILDVIKCIVPFNLKHNAEPEAVDLLLEVGRLNELLDLGIEEGSPTRVCAYLLKCADYLGDADDAASCLSVALRIFEKQGMHTDALTVALKLSSGAGAKPESQEQQQKRISDAFAACADSGIRRQMAYILGRHRSQFRSGVSDTLDSLVRNSSLSDLFLSLARDLDVLEPKTPEDIYKAHLESGSGGRTAGLGAADEMDSAKRNLASTYVNAFVNAGFGKDKLMTVAESNWVYKNKESGQLASAASLGLIHVWNDDQLSSLDRFLDAKEESVRAGAILGIGLCCTGATKNLDADPALALLSDHLEGGPAASNAIAAAAAAATTVSTSANPNSTPPNAANPSTGATSGAGGKHASQAAALMGLGLSYAGSCRADVGSLLLPFVQDSRTGCSFELCAIGSLALGMVFAGSAHEEYASVIADRLLEASDTECISAIARHMALGLGFIFLQRGSAADAILEVLATIGHERPDVKAFGSVAITLVESCAWACTGNVLQIQKLLRICAEHPEIEDKEKEAKEEKEKAEAAGNAIAAAAVANAAAARGSGANAASAVSGGVPTAAALLNAARAAGAAVPQPDGVTAPTVPVVVKTPAEIEKAKALKAGRYMPQSAAVFGLSMVAMGEEMSVQLASRMADHLLAYGDSSVRQSVPLALALCHISDPQYEVIDTLSRLSHDPNERVSQSAIFAMGLAGAGTNNSRVAGLLRSLATFYKNEADALFVTRIAQGLLHMGKGLITLTPFHADKQLSSPVALCGLFATALCGLDFSATIHGKYAHFLYFLATAMAPRFCATVTELGEVCPVEVRVGQAVETVGQAGKPKTITGFQTHSTPVLVGARDRCELADEAYIALTSAVEGIVVLRANPSAKAQRESAKAAKDKETANKALAARVGARSDLRWD